MKPLRVPVESSLLEKELTSERLLRKTQRGNNFVYLFSAKETPHLLQELGRLREWTFRMAGGGIGEPIDIDEYDTKEPGYRQLVVWSPEDKEVVGAYRIGKGYETNLATGEIYDFSKTFLSDFNANTLDLGRAFVRPDYQAKANRARGLFSLDNLWDGLGAVVAQDPRIKYFLGRVVTFPKKNRWVRDLTLYFLEKYFPDPDHLMRPKLGVDYHHTHNELEAFYQKVNEKEGLKKLTQMAVEKGEVVSPLIQAYMKLSPSMRSFGTVCDNDFGGMEETCILVTINDIYPQFQSRYIDSFKMDSLK